MVVDSTYYKLLGLAPESADAAAIKKAYRKLALKWHPDKNPDNKEEAERMFKDISIAYDVLSDPEKKQAYDSYGKEGLDGGASGSSRSGGPGFSHRNFQFHDANDIFASFFGTSNIFDLFNDDAFFGGHGQVHGRRSSSSRQARDPFGDMFSMHTAMGGNPFGGSSMSFSTNMSGFGGGGSFTSTSTTSRIVNGKRIEETTRNENGVETVEVRENGVLTSKTVNGQPQLTNGQSNQNQIRSGSSSNKKSRKGTSSSSSSSRRSAPRAQTSQITVTSSSQPGQPRGLRHTQTFSSRDRPAQFQHQQHQHPHQQHFADLGMELDEEELRMQQSLFDSLGGARRSSGNMNQNPFGGGFPFGRDPFGGGFPFSGGMFGNNGGFPF